MGSLWRKAKKAMGLNLCVHVPSAMGDDGLPSGGPAAGWRVSDAAATATSSPAGSVGASEFQALMPSTPTLSSGSLRVSKSGSRSSKVRSFFRSFFASR